MGYRRRKKARFGHELKSNFGQYSVGLNWFTSLHFWLSRYVKGLLHHGFLSEELIDTVISWGTKKDRLQFIQENEDWLFKKIDTEENEEEFNQYRLKSRQTSDPDVLSELIKTQLEESSSYQIHRKVALALRRYIDNIIPEKTNFSHSIREKSLDELKKLLKLNDTEVELIRFFYCLGFSQLEAIARQFIDDVESVYEFIHMTTGESHRKIRKALHPNSPLFSMGILVHEDKSFSPTGVEYSLKSDIAYCLTGHKTVREYFEKVIQLDKKSVYPLSSFQVSPESLFIAQRLLQADSPTRLLVHGLTGTGKTEFVRSLCRAVGFPTYFLSQGMDGSPSERKNFLEIANQMLSNQQAVVVVDEADELLNTGYRFLGFLEDSVNKGWLNDFLDRAKIKLIFISNDISSIEDSVLRRFQYNIKFDQKRHFYEFSNWKKTLKRKPVNQYLTEDFLERITARYHLTPASLNNAIKALELILKPEDNDPNKIENYFEELLASHEKIVYKEEKKLSELINEKYDVSLINTDIPVKEILTALNNYLQNTERKIRKTGSGVNLLFWGSPGTGKTEFVKFLAKELKAKLVIRRGSDLLSPYVGVTESLIAKAFEEASGSRSILFIDEADSFFTRRENAWRSWEVSQTNEFLTQMENHSCILICCTNLIKNLDPASIRRFHWKVEFKPLKTEHRFLVFQRYFPEKASKDVEKKLLKLDGLTHGDFRAVYNKFLFAKMEGITANDIIEALARELEYRRKQSDKQISGFL